MTKEQLQECIDDYIHYVSIDELDKAQLLLKLLEVFYKKEEIESNLLPN